MTYGYLDDDPEKLITIYVDGNGNSRDYRYKFDYSTGGKGADGRYDDYGRYIYRYEEWDGRHLNKERIDYRAEGEPLLKLYMWGYDNNRNPSWIQYSYEKPGQGLVYEYENFLYDDFSMLTQYTDQNDTSIFYDRDEQTGGLTAIRVPDLGYEYEVNTNDYGQVESITDPEGRVSSFAYDANGNVGSIDSGGILISYSYDDLGRLETETLGSRTTAYAWTDEGLLDRIDYPGGHIDFGYEWENAIEDGTPNLSSIKDSKGNITRYSYDQADRLTSVVDAEQGRTDYEYYPTGDLRAIVNAKRERTTYNYNTSDKLKHIKEIGGAYQCSYGYDDMGNLTKIDDGNDVVDLTVDALGRVYDDGEYEYEYYPNGSLKSASKKGSPLRTSYSYDALGRLDKKKHGAEGQPPSHIIDYDYDGSGNRTKVEYYVPGVGGGDEIRETVEYEYYESNLLHKVKYKGEETEYLYNDEAKLTDVILPNGITSHYEYDSAGRIGKINHLRRADGMTIAFKRYEYDGVGNRILEEDATGKVEYTYDNLYRLTGVKQTKGETVVKERTYTYDANGNRTMMVTRDEEGDVETVNYTFKKHNVLKTAGQWDYTFRVDGNLESKTNRVTGETHSYDWNAANQLTGFNKSVPGDDNTDVSYEYDAVGRRIKRVDQDTSEIEEWVWDGIAEFVTRKNGEIDSVCVNGLGGNISRADKAGNKIYYLKDILGSVIATTDEYGNIIQVFEYDEFGECFNADKDLGDDRSYTGKRLDEDTGLYYFQARWCDGELGRFISRDIWPGFIGAPQTTNPYVYVANNSVNYVDVFGLCGKRSSGLGGEIEVGYGMPPLVRGGLLGFTEWNSPMPGGITVAEVYALLDIAPLGVSPGAGTAVSLYLDIISYGITKEAILQSEYPEDIKDVLYEGNRWNLGIGLLGLAPQLSLPAMIGEGAIFRWSLEVQDIWNTRLE